MPVIDADAHVIESTHTWDRIPEEWQQYRPVLVDPEDGTRKHYWMIDGQIRGLALPVLTAQEAEEYSKNVGRNIAVPSESAGMENVEARLRHMDQLGVDVQVLHPTIFIAQVSDRPEVERALCRGYNTWMGEVYQKGGGRLAWSCALPFLDMNNTIEELHFARERGACAVFMRPIEENNRLIHDPYFYPMFEEAQSLGMTIAVHVGNGNPSIVSLFSSEVGFGSGFFPFNLPIQGAFHATITSGLPMRFPGLRFAFLEAAAQWVPLIMQDLSRRGTRNSLRPLDIKVTAADRVAQLISNSPDLMEEFRLYVGLHTTDDVPYLLDYMGTGSMVIGTDYGHADVNSDIEAIRLMRERGDIGSDVVDNILFHNPSRLYNIDVGAMIGDGAR